MQYFQSSLCIQDLFKDQSFISIRIGGKLDSKTRRKIHVWSSLQTFMNVINFIKKHCKYVSAHTQDDRAKMLDH